MKIKLTDKAKFANGTEVYDSEGNKLGGVKAIDVRMRLNEPVVATIEFVYSTFEEIEAIPLLSLEQLRKYAELHGRVLWEGCERIKDPTEMQKALERRGVLYGYDAASNAFVGYQLALGYLGQVYDLRPRQKYNVGVTTNNEV